MFYLHDTAGLGWGWWVLMTLGMVGFWSLIVYGIVWLTRAQPATSAEREPPEPPEEILKRRLAKGELTLEDYERLIEAVRASAPRSAPATATRSAA
jgi:putative membrane protein